MFTPTDVLPVLDIVTDDPARVVRRSHWLRALGVSLGGLMVGVALYRVGVGVSIWTVWALYAFAWPHVAWLLLRRRREPVALDRMFFVGDAAMCGIWIALMQFNMLPNAVIVAMLAITLIAIDWWQVLGRGMLALLPACLVAMLADGLAFAPDVRCTLSVGVAPRPATRGSIREWVKIVDAALYRAKLAGRDRLAVAM